MPAQPKKVYVEHVASKSDLIMELLGFMEAPGGNVSEYAERCVTATDTSRNFIDTFVRRGWLLAVRVDVASNALNPKPDACTIWPGREWTRSISIKDISREELNDTFPKSQILHEFSLYRFDHTMKEHVIDKLAMIKTFRFPRALPPFELPEPFPELFKNLLMFRLAHEEWQELRLQHSHADYSQYQLLVEKLQVSDQVITGCYRQLKTIMEAMSKMITSLVSMFEDVSVERVKKIVDDIPMQIKSIVSNLEGTAGIIIKDLDKVKLTPLFVKKMISDSQSPGDIADVVARASTTRANKNDSNRSSQSGAKDSELPPAQAESVGLLLQEFVTSSINQRQKDQKSNRRMTLL